MRKLVLLLILSYCILSNMASAENKPNGGKNEVAGGTLGAAIGAAAGGAFGGTSDAKAGKMAGQTTGTTDNGGLDQHTVKNHQSGRGGSSDPHGK